MNVYLAHILLNSGFMTAFMRVQTGDIEVFETFLLFYKSTKDYRWQVHFIGMSADQIIQPIYRQT